MKMYLQAAFSKINKNYSLLVVCVFSFLFSGVLNSDGGSLVNKRQDVQSSERRGVNQCLTFVLSEKRRNGDGAIYNSTSIGLLGDNASLGKDHTHELMDSIDGLAVVLDGQIRIFNSFVILIQDLLWLENFVGIVDVFLQLLFYGLYVLVSQQISKVQIN